jgi:hypothetical protein
MKASRLLQELDATTHDVRMKRMVELGKLALTDPAVAKTLDALEAAGSSSGCWPYSRATAAQTGLASSGSSRTPRGRCAGGRGSSSSGSGPTRRSAKRCSPPAARVGSRY